MEFAQVRRRVSAEALKMIYYVVIGIAITDALDLAFAPGGKFLGGDMVTHERVPTFLMLAAFLLTIFRFVQGASIHLDTIHTGSFKVLFDFLSFFIQATVFYVMALYLADRWFFCVLFIIIHVLDTVWLICLKLFGCIELTRTEIQWIVSNVAIAILLGGILYCDPSVTSRYSSWMIAATALVAFVLDYWMNWSFYFPPDHTVVEARRAG
jgi:hypothetical protein